MAWDRGKRRYDNASNGSEHQRWHWKRLMFKAYPSTNKYYAGSQYFCA